MGVLKSLQSGEYVNLSPTPHEGNPLLHSIFANEFVDGECDTELKPTSEALEYLQKGSPEAQVFHAIAPGPVGTPMADIIVSDTVILLLLSRRQRTDPSPIGMVD